MDIPINDVQKVRERLQQDSKSITYKGTLKKQRNITSWAYKNLKVRQYKVKRMLALTLGSIALIFCLLLFPFIMIGINLSSRGSVFFKQSRTGQNRSEDQTHQL